MVSNLKVEYDYLVSDGVNKNSVLFDLIGEKVDVSITCNTVEVFIHIIQCFGTHDFIPH